MRDLNVDQIKKLWTLDLIIQLGSLRRAAAQINVTPSAISQALSSLERSVGKPLLIRSNGRVIATQDALEILNVVRPAFDAFEKLKDLRNLPTPQLSWLNFGTYESIAVDVLPGLIHRLRNTMPQLRLGLRISRTANLLSMIRKGELCSALVAETDDLGRFYCNEVYVDKLGFYVAKQTSISQLGWRATKTVGIGSISPGKEGLPRYYTRFLKQLGSLRPSVYSDSLEALRTSAAAGALVAVLPQRVAQRHDDLIEIFPSGSKNRECGEHRILVTSLKGCDKEEVDFLATETRRCLANPGIHYS